MNWTKISNIEVGANRFADGEWRFEENEIERKLIVKSNDKITELPVTDITDPNSYESLAEMCVIELNQ